MVVAIPQSSRQAARSLLACVKNFTTQRPIRAWNAKERVNAKDMFVGRVHGLDADIRGGGVDEVGIGMSAVIVVDRT